jgi:hypothetical protein
MRRPKNRTPTPPGEMLLEEYLKPRGLTLQRIGLQRRQKPTSYGQSPNVAPAFSATRTSATGTRTAPTPGRHIGMS